MTIAIDVINVSARPIAVSMEPYQPVGCAKFPCDKYPAISLLID